ncbi:MAG TPA: hypothetical protein VIG55_12375 [Methylosinus sp.]|jgi:ribosomal protein L37E
MTKEQEQTDESNLDAPAFDNTPADMVKAFNEAFPNVKCLRCGHKNFYLVGPFHKFDVTGEESFGNGDVVEIICRRCGLVERHLWQILKNAAKPIDTD